MNKWIAQNKNKHSCKLPLSDCLTEEGGRDRGEELGTGGKGRRPERKTYKIEKNLNWMLGIFLSSVCLPKSLETNNEIIIK